MWARYKDYKYLSYIAGKICYPNPNVPSATRNCCTPDKPCGLGGGDCDEDEDCKGDLICGLRQLNSNNCVNEPDGIEWPDNDDCCIAKRNSYDIIYTIVILVLLIPR